MSCPTQSSSIEIGVQTLDVHTALHGVLVKMQFPLLPCRYPAHLANASVVETVQAAASVGREAPALASEEQDAEDQPLVRDLFVREWNLLGGEELFRC